MSYDKDNIGTLADSLLATFDAVRDGVGMDDIDEAVGLLTSFAGASDEISTDTDAALLHLVAALADRIGDRRQG